jgi:hypothetical protein
MQVQVGAMAHGKIDVDYIDDLVAGIFCLPHPFLSQLSSFKTCYSQNLHPQSESLRTITVLRGEKHKVQSFAL